MSMILNEYDVAFIVERLADEDDKPNLRSAAAILARLIEWTNANSDGWYYWRKPVAASKQLQGLLYDIVLGPNTTFEMREITDRELKQALGHIKAFLTREKVPEATRLTILGGWR